MSIPTDCHDCEHLKSFDEPHEAGQLCALADQIAAFNIADGTVIDPPNWCPLKLEAIAPNYRKEVITIKHSSLPPPNESKYSRTCTVCNEGLLLMRRDKTTLILQPEDNCLLCGQSYFYEDIEDVRATDWARKR
jgi:hypothetical protein